MSPRAMAATMTNPTTTDVNGSDDGLPCGPGWCAESAAAVWTARGQQPQRTLSDVRAEGLSRVDPTCVSSTCTSAA